MSADNIKSAFENLLGGQSQGSSEFRHDIHYQPGYFLRNDGTKLRPHVPDRGERWTAQELNPTHLRDQGLESRIDEQTRNVVYTTLQGEVRVGFYDRAQIEGVVQPPKGEDQIRNELQQLVHGEDRVAPRLPILDPQPYIKHLLGESLPDMFSFRSVEFPRTTTYGFFVDVDRALVGEPVHVQKVELTPEFIRSHPREMNYLLPVVQRTVKERGLHFVDLELSSAVDSLDIMQYIIFQTESSSYSTTISYRATPQLATVARLNGMPIGLTFDGNRAYELGSGGMDLGNSYLSLFSRATFHNRANDAESLVGPLVYEVISRAESIAERAANRRFGLLDIVVMKGYQLDDVAVEFTKTSESPMSSSDLKTTLEQFGAASGVKTRTLGGHTAGRSTVGEVKRATVTTQPFGFESVLFRDVFCLVHEEMGTRPPLYIVNSPIPLYGPDSPG